MNTNITIHKKNITKSHNNSSKQVYKLNSKITFKISIYLLFIFLYKLILKITYSY